MQTMGDQWTTLVLATSAGFPAEFLGRWDEQTGRIPDGRQYYVEIVGRSVVWSGREIVFENLIAHMRDGVLVAMEIEPTERDRDDWGRWNIQYFLLQDPVTLTIANSKMDAKLVRTRSF